MRCTIIAPTSAPSSPTRSSGESVSSRSSTSTASRDVPRRAACTPAMVEKSSLGSPSRRLVVSSTTSATTSASAADTASTRCPHLLSANSRSTASARAWRSAIRLMGLLVLSLRQRRLQAPRLRHLQVPLLPAPPLHRLRRAQAARLGSTKSRA